MNLRVLLSSVVSRFYKPSKPSLNNLDQKLEKYLNFENGFFIGAGANDGYSQSNTYFLEKKRNWNGLLIEAIPELYEKCKKERTKSIVINCALVADDYQCETITMHYANLMSVVDGALKTKDDQDAHIKTGIEVQNLEGSYDLDVPARTLASILDKIPNLPVIDFFSLDVEGYELNVLKGLNLSKYRPTYILVEARFFKEVNRFLESNEYTMIEKLSFHDYLYKTSV